MSNVILPLQEDVLWDIIENGQKDVIVVDVNNSYNNLGDKILYYISNAELNVKLDWTDCDFKTKSEIVLSYINLNRLYKNSELNDTLFDLVMFYKGILTERNGIFNEDQIIDFINNNMELFAKLIPFLDSVILVVGNGFAPIHDKFKPELFEQVTDKSLSLNVCYLFEKPEFVVYYSILEIDNLKWYTIQFNNPIYDNDTLHNIVFRKQCGLSAAIYQVLKLQGLVKE